MQQAGGCSGGVRISGRDAVEGHRGGAERAAEFARGGGAGDAVVAVGVVGGEPAEFVAGEFGGLRMSCAAVSSGVAAGASGPRCSSGFGVAGQYRLPLAMIAPWWVPWGPRSCGCRSWTSCAPAAGGAGGPRRRRRGGRSRSRRGCRRARSPSPGMRVSDGGEGADGVGVAGGQGDPPGQFRDGRAGPRRGSSWRPRGSSRRTSPLWGRAGWSCGAPRTPRGRRRSLLPWCGGREKDSTSVQSTASDVLRCLCARPGCWLPAGHPAPRRGRRTGCRPACCFSRAAAMRPKVRSAWR